MAHHDDNLRFRGDLIWDGTHVLTSGIEGSEIGCQPSNPGCNESQFHADNMINITEPQLINPAGGDFRPLPNGNLFSIAAYAMPDFTWDDAPARPAVPMGNLSNIVAFDRAGNDRAAAGPVGAYGSASDSPPPQPSTFTVNGRTVNKKSKAIAGT